MNKKTKLSHWSKKDVEKYHKWTRRGYAGDKIAQIIVRLSKKYIGKKVLDVGAGSGALIDLIPGAIGIDLVPKNKKVKKGDITKLQFKDGSFDTVFSTDVLEHLDDKILAKGLKEIYRVLKDGGYYIIVVPDNEDLELAKVYCPKCKTSFHRVGHMQSFSPCSMEKLLKKYGFKVTSLKEYPFSFERQYPKLRWLILLLAKYNIIKTKKLYVVAQK